MSDAVVDPLAHMSAPTPTPSPEPAKRAPRKRTAAAKTTRAQKAPASPVSVASSSDVQTPEQRRIAELEAQLAALEAQASVPVSAASLDEAPEYVAPEDRPDNILIHFLVDGFTAWGQVWFRGQEVEVSPGSSTYEDTKDRNGNSWLDLRDDEYAQIDRYGEHVFRTGPWRGKNYRAAAGAFEVREGVKPPTEDELIAAEQAEARRRRAAPRVKI